MPESTLQLKPLILSELKPPLSVTVIHDNNGLDELSSFIAGKLAVEVCPAIGLDTETNMCDDFWFRRATDYSSR